MKNNNVLFFLLLALMSNLGLNAQITQFGEGDDEYLVLKAEDGSLTNEVALIGWPWQTTYYGNGYIPDEVTDGAGKSYKVVRFGYFDKCEKTISKLTLGRNIREIRIKKRIFPLEEGYSVAEGNKYFKAIDGILYTGDGKTLIHCPAQFSHTQPGSLTKKTVIPDSVEVIGDEAFLYCERIEQIQLPSNLRVIGNYAFASFRNLAGNLIIPSKVERIGNYAFASTAGLEHIELPEGLKYMGHDVFQGTKITSLTLPASLDTLLSFGIMDELESITCLSKIPPKVDKNNFKNDVRRFFIPNVVLIVPGGCRDAYANDECWGLFTKIVEIGEEEKKCAAPTIKYVEGRLVCTSETDGAKCVVTVSSPDMGIYAGSEVPLLGTYFVSTYAKKEGYEDSELVTATLYWIEKELKPDGMDAGAIQANVRPVIVSSTGNTLTVQGAEDGESLTAYSLDGKLLGTAVCRNGQACIPLSTNLADIIIIVKAGENAIKVRVR